MQKATIIKIGNSYGVRLKKDYLDHLELAEGDEVEFAIRPSSPPKQIQGNQGIIAAFRMLQEMGGGIPSIPDPAAWQREIRKDRPLDGRDW